MCYQYSEYKYLGTLQVFKDRPSSGDGFLHDYHDGQIYKEHPLFASDSKALQLIIYFDEVEVANPLGSHRGVHKLGM